jgi:hypothetical protein
LFQLVSGAIGTSDETVFGARVRFTCPEGQVFATGVERIDTRCMPGGKWSQAYIPKCQQVSLEDDKHGYNIFKRGLNKSRRLVIDIALNC